MRPTEWRKRMLILALATSPLIGCAADRSNPIEPRVVVVCGTVAAYSQQQMAAAADELAALPATSILASVIVPDLGRMRDEARACAKGSK